VFILNYKKTVFYTVVIAISVMLLTACSQEENKPDTEKPQNKEDKVAVGAYYPLAVGNQWEYEGIGNEYASYTQKVVYSKDDKYQVMVDNGGTVSANIYVLSDESLIRTYSEAEVYDDKNILDEKENMNNIMIKAPIEIGTKWESQGDQCEITDINATVTVPAGTFENCIVIKETYNETGAFTNYYYCKGVGLVKSEYIDGDFQVSSLLKNYKLSEK